MATQDGDRWRSDVERVTRILDEIEQTHRVILSALGCPTDPVQVYAQAEALAAAIAAVMRS